MNTRNIQRITVLVLLAIGLAMFLSLPAQGQDSQQNEEELNWYQKLTTSEGINEQFQNNQIVFFLGVFVLGVGVSLTPCVLPMIPITVSIISGSKQAVAGRSAARSALAGFANSLVYVLGVSITLRRIT